MSRSLIERTWQVIGIGVVCIVMSGCSWSVGGKKSGSTVIEPTKGQQLIDLQKAHASGAVSEQEYQKLKTGIIGD